MRLYLRLLRCGYSLLATDADTVWLRDPSHFVGRTLGVSSGSHATSAGQPAATGGGGGGGGDGNSTADASVAELHSADVMVSVDENYIEKDTDPQLILRDFNTGMLFLRATAATIGFVVEWASRPHTQCTVHLTSVHR